MPLLNGLDLLFSQKTIESEWANLASKSGIRARRRFRFRSYGLRGQQFKNHQSPNYRTGSKIFHRRLLSHLLRYA
jgi:hypothetical protein